MAAGGQGWPAAGTAYDRPGGASTASRAGTKATAWQRPVGQAGPPWRVPPAFRPLHLTPSFLCLASHPGLRSLLEMRQAYQAAFPASTLGLLGNFIDNHVRLGRRVDGGGGGQSVGVPARQRRSGPSSLPGLHPINKQHSSLPPPPCLEPPLSSPCPAARLQDNPRFLYVQPDMQLYKNALTWVLPAEGEPYEPPARADPAPRLHRLAASAPPCT